MRLISWLGDFYVVLTFERQQRKEIRVGSANQDVSVWETFCTRITHHMWTCTWAYETFKIDFQCRSWNKEQGIEDVQAPVSCSCLSLLGETVIVYFCLSSGRTMWCCQTLSYVPLFVVSSYDGVLWDTVMCTSLSPRVSWCGVVRHCNVYLSLSPCLLVWCGETLQCVPFSVLMFHGVVLWDTVMCTSLCPRVPWCDAVRRCKVYLSLSPCLMVWCCETL